MKDTRFFFETELNGTERNARIAPEAEVRRFEAALRENTRDEVKKDNKWRAESLEMSFSKVLR
jgi:hypothetical protein